MPTEPDIARIAAGLTKSQREAVINGRFLPIIGMGYPICLVEFVNEPWPAKLCQFFTIKQDSLTALGLAVRRHLLASQTSGEEG